MAEWKPWHQRPTRKQGQWAGACCAARHSAQLAAGVFRPAARGCTGQPRRANQLAEASERLTADVAVDGSVAGCRESLRGNRSSAGIHIPYQRPKRLNDGHSVANVAGEGMQHMRRSREWSRQHNHPAEASRERGCFGGQRLMTLVPATQRPSVAALSPEVKPQVRPTVKDETATEATEASYI